MDKQDTDSLATVTVKEYPPSEVFGSEPPPAYQKLRPNSVQIARIAAVTLVTMSVILGIFILAASYVNATYSCQNIHMRHENSAGAGDAEDQPSFQHLVDPLQSEESAAVAAAAADTNRLGAGSRGVAAGSGAQQQQQQQRSSSEEDDVGGGESDEAEDDEEEPQPVRIKLPLTLDFDDLAGALVERNQRSRMNCVVEKRRAEQVVDHQPRTLRLPFGVNLTTDPRYEHVSGERMAIFCESGKEQRHMPMDMMAATPVVVPLPGPVHLPIQFHGHLQQAQSQAHAQAQAQAQAQARAQAAAMEQARAQAAAMEQARAQAQTQARARSFPQPHPHQVLQQLHQHLMHQQQLKEQHLQRMQQMKEQQELAEQEREQMRDREQAAAAAAAMHASIRVIEKAMPIQIAESRHIPIQVTEARQVPMQMAEAHHIPLQLAEARHIPIQVAEARPVAIEEATGEEAIAVAREGRAFQGDAAPFPRLPVHVPVPLMQAVAVEQPQPRPHYVQPRSVRAARSVEDVFLHKREKRMRRCACDCSC